MGRGIVFFIIFLIAGLAYGKKKQPTAEEIAQERAVQEAMAQIDEASVKEEAQRRAIARAQRLSFAYASGAEAPIFSLLRPLLGIGFELRQNCVEDACLPLTSVRFGGEVSLNLWILDIFGRGGGGIAYHHSGVQGLRWHGWGHLGVRHNLIGTLPLEVFLEVASNPYERIAEMGMGVDSGSKTEWGAGISAGGKLGGSAISVFLRFAAPELFPSGGGESGRQFSVLAGVQMIAPPVRGFGSQN